MKTPGEIKKGLECVVNYNKPQETCAGCPYSEPPKEKDHMWICDCPKIYPDALSYIEQLEANWNQVSKALCGKENATLEEVLQVIDQVTTRTFALPARSGKTLAAQRIYELEKELATVKRERDAAVESLRGDCRECKYHHASGMVEPCSSCRIEYRQSVRHFSKSHWQWKGVLSKSEESSNEQTT